MAYRPTNLMEEHIRSMTVQSTYERQDAAVGSQDSEISVQLDNCMKQLEVAHQAITGLTERLSPVLRSPSPKTAATQTARGAPICHTKLGASLVTVASGINQLADELRALESRVEL